MIFRWLKARRRRKLIERPAPGEWETWLREDVSFYGKLEQRERERLVDLARVFMAEKHWEGREGLPLNDRIKLSIAVQACLLILHIEHDYYRRVGSIFVFPHTVAAPIQRDHLQQVIPVSGVASSGGPIVLSWDAVRGGAMNSEDGHNVVLHEFAHALDHQDDWTDGTPPLPSRAKYDRWVDVMTANYEALVEHVHAGRRSVMDAYGSTNPAEFFAVATETFFEKPTQMKHHLRDLYDVLKDYYHQDPAGWR